MQVACMGRQFSTMPWQCLDRASGARLVEGIVELHAPACACALLPILSAHLAKHKGGGRTHAQPDEPGHASGGLLPWRGRGSIGVVPRRGHVVLLLLAAVGSLHAHEMGFEMSGEQEAA